MKQLVLEIDDATEERINHAAKIAGLSSEQWLKQIIDEKILVAWPDSVKALAGAWQDFPTVKELRANEVQDIQRESF